MKDGTNIESMQTRNNPSHASLPYKEFEAAEDALDNILSRVAQVKPSDETRVFAAIKSLEKKIEQIRQAIGRSRL
jgi:hypothetical protein